MSEHSNLTKVPVTIPRLPRTRARVLLGSGGIKIQQLDVVCPFRWVIVVALLPVLCNLLSNYFQSGTALLRLASVGAGVAYIASTVSSAGLLVVCFSFFTFGTYGIGVEVPGANAANLVFVAASIKYLAGSDGSLSTLWGRIGLRPLLAPGAVYLVVRAISLVRGESNDWVNVVANIARNLFLFLVSFNTATVDKQRAEQGLSHCLVIAIVFLSIGCTKGMALAAQDAAASKVRVELVWGAAGIGFLSGLVLSILWLLSENATVLKQKLVLILGMALTGTTLLLSFSRTATIALVCAVVFTAAFRRRRVFLMGTLVLGAAVAALVPAKYFERFRELHENPQIVYGEEQSRAEINLGPAVYAFERNPLFGVGFRKYMSERGGVTLFRAHNQYTEEFAETGFVGLLALLYLLGRICKVCWNLGTRTQFGARWRFAIRGALVFWLVFGLQGSLGLDSVSGGLMMILIGIAAALNERQTAPRRNYDYVRAKG